jgi:hypothetical protein
MIDHLVIAAIVLVLAITIASMGGWFGDRHQHHAEGSLVGMQQQKRKKPRGGGARFMSLWR